jgi:peroxisomal coenzyme A diphosphatase NUDT7
MTPDIHSRSLKQALSRAKISPAPGDPSFKKACVFLLLFGEKDPHAFFIQKTDTVGYPWRNQVALPGGHLEKKDPSPLHAAYRELHEETGILKDHVEFLFSLGHFQTIRSIDIEALVGWWNEKDEVRFDSREISRILEVPLATLLQVHAEKGFAGKVPGVEELVYPLGPVKDAVIWGATARIVHFFIEAIRPFF